MQPLSQALGSSIRSILNLVIFSIGDIFQVLIVNGFIGTAETGVWSPLFYCLMPRKTRAEYSRIYTGLSQVQQYLLSNLLEIKLLQLLQREGSQFPANVPVMADFEVWAQFCCYKS